MRVLMSPAQSSKDDNPFVSILSAGVRAAGAEIVHFDYRASASVDAFHVHWLERVFWGRLSSRIPPLAARRARAVVSQASLTRSAGGRVIWTAHNLQPHEALSQSRASVWRGLCDDFLPLVTDVILMSPESKAGVLSTYPQLGHAAFHVVPHPHYRDFFAAHADLSPRSRAPGPLRLACVGKLRPYKGVLQVVHALRATDRDFSLTVSGDGQGDYLRRLRDAMGDDRRFRLRSENLSHAGVVEAFRQADAAVFNFERILNSGSVLAALSVGTPILSAPAPSLDSLRQTVGETWMRSFETPVDGVRLLNQAEDLLALRCADRQPPLDNLSPEAVGRAHAAIYSGVVS